MSDVSFGDIFACSFVSILRLVFTSDGVGVGVVSGVIRVLMTK